MNLNNFSYYRRNPYHREGFMPPIGHQNRHPPDFLTEIPMGQQHLGNTGRRHFRNQSTRSNIDQNQIFKSPQKYPFQNRIAIDKSYSRALNIIDIEGSTPGSTMSLAVKNKIKAQEQLQRRKIQQQHYNISYHQFAKNKSQNSIQNGNSHLLQSKFNRSEEDRRREMALKQFLKNKELADLLSGRNLDNRNKVNIGQASKGVSPNYYLRLPERQEQLSMNQRRPQEKKQEHHRQISRKSREYYDLQQSPEENPQYHRGTKENEAELKEYKILPIQKSLKLTKQDQDQNIQGDRYISLPQQSSFQSKQASNPLESGILNRSRLFTIKNQIRKMNPTYLSYGSPIISLAAKQALGY